MLHTAQFEHTASNVIQQCSYYTTYTPASRVRVMIVFRFSELCSEAAERRVSVNTTSQPNFYFVARVTQASGSRFLLTAEPAFSFLEYVRTEVCAP